MNRRTADKSLLDLGRWPEVSTLTMTRKDRVATERRIRAMRLYVMGASHLRILGETGFDRRRVVELFNRCVATHPDGNLWGFRACRFRARVRIYTRTLPERDPSRLSTSGHAGMLRAVFSRFPHIAEALRDEIGVSRKRGFVESSLRFDKLHAKFVAECKKAGIAGNAYPFTVISQGARSLNRWIKEELASLGSRKLAHVIFGEDAARKLGNQSSAVRIGSRRQCFQRVEFDGHRLDVLMVIIIPDPAGGEPVCLAIERIWLLVVIDAASRAILGYHVSFDRNYSAEDVLICLENALLPWRPRKLVVPGLSYPAEGGFPSQIPELAFARWGELAIDNAKSNTSAWVWERVQKSVGCVLNPGPVRTPDRRQFVERFFAALEQGGFQRLPTTTGSSSRDVRRRDPEDKAIRYQVTVDEMQDLLDVLISQYNGTPTSALHGRSPLEYLRFALSRDSFFVRQIPEEEREGFSLTILQAHATVRGSLKRGERPYIRYMGVRYYSEKLNNSPRMIGQKVVIECRTRDLRRLKIFTSNGDEFGTVEVSQAWAAQPHDLRTRKAILRCINHGKIERRNQTDVVGAYIDHKTQESGKKRKSRNELAHAIRVRRETPTTPIALPVKNEEPAITRIRAPRIEVSVRAINF